MARYYFHLVAPGESNKDHIGTDLPDAEAAYLEACDTALEISYEMLRKRLDPSRHAFEITDEGGSLLFEVPFAEVTRPADHITPLNAIQASIRRRHKRATQTISELRVNFKQARSLLNSTRTLLTKI
jgi:hypothetical protein